MVFSRTADPIILPREGDVRVWIARISKTSTSLSAFSQVLSFEEEQKAARFRRSEDRIRSIIARGLLRHVMGGYLSVAPRDVAFTVNAFGKPALLGGLGYPPLHFNVAHSGDLVLCAVAMNRRVGVDVELIRPELEVMSLARGHFSLREIERLEGTLAGEQLGAFFQCWTRKEACVKAWGEGLSFPLDKFAVSFGLREQPRIDWLDPQRSPTGKWSLCHLELGVGYAGAVVVEGAEAHLISTEWTGLAD